MTDAELAGLLREHALLEGDFVLRSGRRSSYYLDKYRFETRPDLLRSSASGSRTRVRESAPEATRLAGPELGAVALAASASLAGSFPFLIVRKEAKGYGTERRIEGEFAAGEEVCLVEDVVTSGGAAEQAVEALREAGLVVPDSGLRGRSGGGRGRRARAQSGAPRADFHGLGHPAGLKRPANPHGCVLSGVAVRVLAVSQAMNVDGRRGQ